MHPTDKCGTRKLITWEKWTWMREAETKTLGKKTNRPTADLVMNLATTVRSDKEEKLTLEHAQIEKKAKIRRGTLWQQPSRLKQNCPCKPVYEAQRTAAEMGEPGVIEHIGVPKEIQINELGISEVKERPVGNLLNLDYTCYKSLRLKQLRNKIKKIDPHKPEVDKLIVKGERPRTPPRKLPPLPIINITEVQFPEPVFEVYALKINDNIFFKEQPGQNLDHLHELKMKCKSDCSKWTYYFNVPVRRAGRSKFYLENFGTVSIKYFWKRIRKFISFIPEDNQDQVFFFNKNEDIICPGQSKDILITLVSDKPGFFCEDWEFCIVNYNFYDTSAKKFEINLSADVTIDTQNMRDKIKLLKEDIIYSSKLNIVRTIIDDIFEKAIADDPEIYPYVNYLLEEDMFILMNPVCFYHQTEVHKLKMKYEELTGKTWDLSINSWREAMMEKEYTERMLNYDYLKKSYNDLLKPWYEGEDLMTRKYRAVKQLLLQLADKFDEEFKRIVDNDIYFITEKNSPVVEESPSIRSNQAILYLTMYGHFCLTMEFCAGALSSLDMNRWFDIDFCYL